MPITAVAASTIAGAAFVVGLVIGVLLGIVAAPIVRSAIVHSEWRRASREARLTDVLLDRIERDATPPRGRPQPPAHGPGT